MSKVLGLDLGVNSIGWAIIDMNNNQIHSGVRIFQEGVDNFNLSKEMSKNASRREKRALRVQNRRRRQRRDKLVNILTKLDLMPVSNTDSFFSMNPYELRKKGLYEPLNRYELGRVLYHINQRRGYKSNRKTDVLAETAEEKAKKKETGIVESSIADLRNEIDKGGFKTLGEYLASLDSHEKRIRKQYTQRQMYIDEFDLLWDIQKEFHPEILTDENKEIIRDEIIFYQRPLQSQRDKVGYCPFENKEPNKKRRAPKSSPIAQEFRMLQQVNSLTISSDKRIDNDEIQLTMDERSKLLDFLYNNPAISLKKTGKFKQVLGLDKRTIYKINLESLGKLDGMKTNEAIKKAIGTDLYQELDESELFKMWDVLYFAEERSWLKDNAKKKWGFDDATAEKFSKINLESGFSNLSTKAMRKMIPYLKEGKKYHEAAMCAGYNHYMGDINYELKDFLDSPVHISNPIVMQVLNQLRNVVNELIERFGKPDTIIVELGRDLKMPLQKRLDVLSKNSEKRLKNESTKDVLEKDHKIENPSQSQILRYKLWEEFQETCPYTGKKINIKDLFNDNIIEIDHIYPYSRCLDDSYMNKTICFKKANQEKGKDIPYDYFLKNNIDIAAVKERIKHLPHAKAKRFLTKEIAGFDQFIERQLNDTRFASRAAKDYLRQIVHDVNVCSGMATSLIRYYWGLNTLLRPDPKKGNQSEAWLKNREDHRHHAIDAIVIALIDRKKLQVISTYHALDNVDYRYKYAQMQEDTKLRRYFKPPWPNFNNKVRNSLNNIIISHKLNKRVRGALHEETMYGKRYDIYGNPDVNEKSIPLYSCRKPVSNLTPTEVHKIVDPVIREIVMNRLDELDIDVNKKIFKIPKNAFAEPLYLIGKSGVATQIKKVRIARAANAVVNIRGYNLWVEPGNNHHIIIYNENGKVYGKVVSLFDAAKRRREGLPIIDKELDPGKEFMFSLQRNELVIMDEIPKKFDPINVGSYHLVFDKIYRVQKMSMDTQVTFRKHNVAVLETVNRDGEKYEPGVLRKNPSALNCTKIKISPTGLIEYDYD